MGFVPGQKRAFSHEHHVISHGLDIVKFQKPCGCRSQTGGKSTPVTQSNQVSGALGHPRLDVDKPFL